MSGRSGDRDGAPAPAPRGSGRRLGFAAAGVMLAAADTYVVVLALPRSWATSA